MKIQRAIAVMIISSMLFAGVALLAQPVSAATESDPDVYPLIAAKQLRVGDVLVWDDGENIYVKFVMTEPNFYLTQVHVDVKNSISAIPQTRSGNPIPGQFAVKESYDLGDQVTESAVFSFDMSDLGISSSTDAFVAAHAVVENPVCPLWPEETAWGLGEGFSGANWGQFIWYWVD